jgi:hypothetical protein
VNKGEDKCEKKNKNTGPVTTASGVVAPELGKKCSVKQLVSKIKYRSNSYHNLPTSAMVITKDLSKK